MNVRVVIEAPSARDVDAIHATLTTTYWSPDIPRHVVERACANSICAIARGEAGDLIGFARVVSDHATFAWLCDVFVAPAHRGQGLARALVETLQSHPDLQNLRRWLLGTKDAHGVYAPLGFEPLDQPDRMMQIRNRSPYGKQSS